MIFRPDGVADPVMRVGDQIGDAITAHHRVASSEVRRRVSDLLAEVGIADPRAARAGVPHQLSGGCGNGL